MKILAICVVKNEADIIYHTLKSAAEWCDYIYVLDNGSDDETWKIINTLASKIPNIVPWKSINCPFNNCLRADVFNQFRNNAAEGDWWCRLDADEIYLDSPRDFIRKHINANDEVVWSIHIQYYFTDIDLEKYKENQSAYAPEIPPDRKYHYYCANASEARFFKYRKRLEWRCGAWPKHMGRVCKNRIRVKHYQYRSPEQIEKRLRDRLSAKREGCDSFSHIKSYDWTRLIRNANELYFDGGNSELIIDENKIPVHMEGFSRRMGKNIMHGLKIWP